MVEHRWSVALPEPTSYEAAISLALRIRDFDSDLQQFWPLKAKEFGANPGAEVLAEIDEAWRRLTWATIHELIAATGEETARIRAVLSAFPVGERGYAWANERGRLASPRSVETKEHAYRMRLLGPDFERDGSWLVESNKAHLAGEALVKSWRDWLKAEAWAGRSTIARNHELEAAAVSAVADQLGPRQLYADWLLEQPGAAAVGELIQVATVDSENPWRSALMLDIGPGAYGPLYPFLMPSDEPRRAWAGGLAQRLAVSGDGWPFALTWPAACRLEDLTIDAHLARAQPLLDHQHPLRAIEVTLGRATPQTATELIGQLVESAKHLPRVEQVVVSPQGRMAGLARQFAARLGEAFRHAAVRVND